MLLKHQKIALKNLDEKKAMLLVRLPGSGKTYILIEHIRRNGFKSVLWVTPANLRKPTLQEFHKWGFNSVSIVTSKEQVSSSEDVKIVSYAFIRKYSKLLASKTYDIIITDEAHHYKNQNSMNYKSIKFLRVFSTRFVGLTATPFQNNPQEFFSILSIVKGKYLNGVLDNCLKYERTDFYDRILHFFKETGLQLKRKNRGSILTIGDPTKFSKITKPIIDYLPLQNYVEELNYPKIKESTHSVELTTSEEEIYLNEFKKLKSSIKKKLNSLEQDIDALKIFNSTSTLRQLLLFINGKCSSKIINLLSRAEELSQNSNNRVVVFSNFVELGTSLIHKQLNEKGIPTLHYSGKETTVQRNNLLKKFLAGESNILVMSPVGFEGLNLHSATHVLVADPHFNPERMTQLVYRVIRYGTEVEKVHIEHFISTFNESDNETIDEKTGEILRKKQYTNNLFIEHFNQ